MTIFVFNQILKTNMLLLTYLNHFTFNSAFEYEVTISCFCFWCSNLLRHESYIINLNTLNSHPLTLQILLIESPFRLCLDFVWYKK